MNWLRTHLATVLYVGAMVFVILYARHLTAGVDARLSYRNCLAIENLKAGQREAAQATIDGDRLLLKDHDENGTSLPVPKQAILDDIAAKQKVVDRFPARDCGKAP